MRLEFIIGLQLLIIAFISYVITITFAGWFESFVAQKVGDDAPENAGFLTLNPLDHFNVFGFAAVLWGMFFSDIFPLIPGWGRYIPLIPDNISGNYYKLRIFVEYIGRSFAHLLLLISVAILMMIICGPTNVYGFIPMLTSKATSFNQAIVQLLSFVAYQNLILFVIHFILGIFKYVIYFHMPRIQEISFVTIVFAFIALFFVLSIFGPLLEGLAFKVVTGVQSLLMLFIK